MLIAEVMAICMGLRFCATAGKVNTRHAIVIAEIDEIAAQ